MLIYIILGIIQGIFEWLPVSSQGVVALFSQWLVKDFNPVEIALFLHLGTLLAVLVYFFKDFKNLVLLKDLKLLNFLIIATFVSGIVGFLLYQTVVNLVLGAGLLFLTGFGLLFTAYFHRRNLKLKLKDNWLAVVVGFLQGLAVIPGFSRSAATIFGLSLTKNKPKEILRISYILSAPVILATGIFLHLKNPITISKALPALIASFIIGVIFLKILLDLSQKINFFKFALIFALLCFLGGAIVLFL